MRFRLVVFLLLIALATLGLTGCEELGIELPETPVPNGEMTPTPETPDANQTPDMDQTSDVDETPDTNQTPNADETPDMDETPDADQTPDTNQTPGADETPDADQTPTADETPSAAVGEAPQNITVADMGRLDDFDSYRVQTVATWTLDIGEVIVIEVMTQAETEGDQVTRHSAITVSQNGEETEGIEFVTRGDRAWLRTNDEWQQVNVSPDDILGQLGWLGQPDELLSEDARGRFIREEMVNEWTTWRYRFGYDAFADEERFEQLENAEAEIWVAPERDNVPVRMRVRMVGQDVDERSGVLEIESEVQSIDEPVDIPLPPELEGEDMAPDQTPETPPDQTPDMDETPDATPESDQTPMAEAPALLTQRDISMIPEATDVQALANVVIFTVARSPEEVIQFYTDEMEAAGWQAGGETGETTAQFTRESESVSIVALQRPTGDQSTVIITIDNGT
jgi:hypothetical protein